MAELNLTIHPYVDPDTGSTPNGGANVPDDPNAVAINENVTNGTVVGEIKGWESTVWNGTPRIELLNDIGGRYALEWRTDSAGVLHLYLVVANAGGDLPGGGKENFDYEDDAFHHDDGTTIHSGISFQIFDDSSDTVPVHQGNFDVYLNDIALERPNEAPTITVTGPTSFEANDTGAVATPFAGVEIADGAGETDDLTVKIAFLEIDGDLVLPTTLPPGITVTFDFIGSGATRQIVYTFTVDMSVLGGIANLNTFLDTIAFDPQDRPDATDPGTHTTRFEISVTDEHHATPGPTGTSNVIEVVTNITDKTNEAPTITVTGDTEFEANDTGAVAAPFVGLAIADGAGETDDLTLKIGFLAADGDLVLPGTLPAGITVTSEFIGSGDTRKMVYTISVDMSVLGDIANLNTFLHAVTFDPKDRPDATAAGTHRTQFEISVTDEHHAAPGAGGTTNVIEVVTNITEKEPDNEAPTNILISQDFVREFSPNDVTIVGVLSAVDAGDDRGHNFAFAPGGDAEGRFKLEGSAATGWSLVVADGMKLDYEQVPFHDVFLIATDAGGLSSAPIMIRIYIDNMFEENLVGSGEGDLIKASSWKDVIDGAGGNDTIHGGGGADELSGGDGADQFVFDAILDAAAPATIKDFNPAEDKIVLDSNVFSGIVQDSGFVADFVYFEFVDAMPETDVQILYDEMSGALLFDPDGLGDEPMQIFAILENMPTAAEMNNTHFLII